MTTLGERLQHGIPRRVTWFLPPCDDAGRCLPEIDKRPRRSAAPPAPHPRLESRTHDAYSNPPVWIA